MNRGIVLAAVLLACSLPMVAAAAASPLPQQEHTGIPPLPSGSGGYVYDPQTGQYAAPGGRAIWVPGHWESGAKGRIWVAGQWMYPVAPK